MTLASNIADQLAASSPAGLGQQYVICDRSLAPPGAPFAVALPRCPDWSCASHSAAVTEGDQADFYGDLLAPGCWLAMADADRQRLLASTLPTARKAIDHVSGGAARIVEPGYEDVARIASADQRAEIMLALRWLIATCLCLQALIESLPDDTLPGLYVRAGLTPPTTEQLADAASAQERMRNRSADLSAYLLGLAEQRRRHIPGDLFADFGVDT